MNLQRWKTFIVKVFNVRTECTQRIHQIADWPLVHTWCTGQFVVATGQRQCRRQRAKRGSGIAQEQLCLLDRKITATALHTEHMRLQFLHTDTQWAQAIQHALGVVRQQHIAYLSRVLRQGRQQQYSIGNALRAGQGDRAARTEQRGKIKKIYGCHYDRTALRFCEGEMIPQRGAVRMVAGGSPAAKRSEERRVGKECRSRWSP